MTLSETRDPWATSLTLETVPINKNILAKLWVYYNIDKEKKYIISF